MTEETKTPTVKDTKNGITRPKAGTKTAAVWDVADALSAKAGSPASRADVVRLGEEKGLNLGTIATQYGRWRKYYGLAKEVKPEDAKEPGKKASKKNTKASDVVVE